MFSLYVVYTRRRTNEYILYRASSEVQSCILSILQEQLSYKELRRVLYVTTSLVEQIFRKAYRHPI